MNQPTEYLSPVSHRHPLQETTARPPTLRGFEFLREQQSQVVVDYLRHLELFRKVLINPDAPGITPLDLLFDRQIVTSRIGEYPPKTQLIKAAISTSAAASRVYIEAALEQIKKLAENDFPTIHSALNNLGETKFFKEMSAAIPVLANHHRALLEKSKSLDQANLKTLETTDSRAIASYCGIRITLAYSLLEASVITTDGAHARAQLQTEFLNLLVVLNGSTQACAGNDNYKNYPSYRTLSYSNSGRELKPTLYQVSEALNIISAKCQELIHRPKNHNPTTFSESSSQPSYNMVELNTFSSLCQSLTDLCQKAMSDAPEYPKH